MKKILVVGPAWVGDMIMAQALFARLRQRHDDIVRLDVLAPAWTLPLLSAMPEVNQGIPLPFEHGDLALRQRWVFAQSLRSVGYTHAYVLPNSWKSAWIPWAARIPKRIGWRGEWRVGLLNDCRRLDKQRFPLMVQRFVALAETAIPTQAMPLEQIPFPQLRLNRVETAATLDTHLPHHRYEPKPILSLCPGAEFGAAKQWPVAYFGAVAKHFIRQGYRIVILGSARDQMVGQGIVDALQQSSDGPQNAVLLTGKTSLIEATHLLSQSQAVVSNDSGLLHVAAAVGRPVVAIYGPTDPGFTPPLTERASILQADLGCRPCFQRDCPLKHHQCMQGIYPQMVIEAIEAQLKAERVPETLACMEMVF